MVLISLLYSLAGDEMYGDGSKTDCDMNHFGWLRQYVVQCIFGNDIKRLGCFLLVWRDLERIRVALFESLDFT